MFLSQAAEVDELIILEEQLLGYQRIKLNVFFGKGKEGAILFGQ